MAVFFQIKKFRRDSAAWSEWSAAIAHVFGALSPRASDVKLHDVAPDRIQQGAHPATHHTANMRPAGPANKSITEDSARGAPQAKFAPARTLTRRFFFCFL